jgi:hypothetical protein
MQTSVEREKVGFDSGAETASDGTTGGPTAAAW